MTAPAITSRGAPSSGTLAGGLPGALAAEWVKFWSLVSTWWCLAAAAVLGVGFSALMALALDDQLVASQAVVPGMQITQFAIVALATLVITGEYATHSIRATLQAVPVRGRLLAAKVLVPTSLMLVLGMALAMAGAGVGLALVPEATLEFPDAVRDVFAIGGYTALLTAFTIGVGTALRSTAATLTVQFMLLMAVPTVLYLSGRDALLTAAEYFPAQAGQYLMQGGPGAPYGPWAAVGLLLAWSLGSLLLGYLVLRHRDA